MVHVSQFGELGQAEPQPATGTHGGLESLGKWLPDKMAGVFLLVIAALFFGLSYHGAVVAPLQALSLDAEGIMTNRTLVGGW